MKESLGLIYYTSKDRNYMYAEFEMVYYEVSYVNPTEKFKLSK